ncbi:hypothetical protein J6TS7_20690 [Paenibacillus dendritiformis]|nr:hypothetical protein J6TS7_20690 [Paenibacillus dendritiformis]
MLTEHGIDAITISGFSQRYEFLDTCKPGSEVEVSARLGAGKPVYRTPWPLLTPLLLLLPGL